MTQVSYPGGTRVWGLVTPVAIFKHVFSESNLIGAIPVVLESDQNGKQGQNTCWHWKLISYIRGLGQVFVAKKGFLVCCFWLRYQRKPQVFVKMEHFYHFETKVQKGQYQPSGEHLFSVTLWHDKSCSYEFESLQSQSGIWQVPVTVFDLRWTPEIFDNQFAKFFKLPHANATPFLMGCNQVCQC